MSMERVCDCCRKIIGPYNQKDNVLINAGGNTFLMCIEFVHTPESVTGRSGIVVSNPAIVPPKPDVCLGCVANAIVESTLKNNPQATR